MSTPALPHASERSSLTTRIRSNLAGAERLERLAIDLTAPVVAERHASRDFYKRRVLALVDAVALATGILTASALIAAVHFSTHGLWAMATIPAWLLLFNLYGLYANDARRISHTGADEIPAIFHAFLIGSACLWIYFQHAPPGKVEFAPILCFAAATAVSMVALRAFVRAGFARLLGPERVLFVGSGWSTGALTRRMRNGSHALAPVGMITADGSVALPRDVPVLGTLKDTDMDAVVARYGVDRVVVDANGLSEDDVLALLKRCKQLSVKISLLPAAFGVVGTSAAVDHVGGIALLALNPPVLSRSARITKRAVDIGGALTLLVLLSPVFLLAAAAVRLDSRGPVFFRQWRVGKSGRRFRIFKFRTMVVDAEERRAELLERSGDSNWLLIEDDPRTTPVGRFLRRTSVDEIPQLLNVLRGDMSLVGPRPLIPEEDDRVGEWARTRLDLTPGMTGLWQVLGRTTIPFEEMVKLDYLYVTNWSLWGDVKLALQTFPVVLARRGAN